MGLIMKGLEILQVLMYLFNQGFSSGHLEELAIEPPDWADQQGFDQDAVENAINWLLYLGELKERFPPDLLSQNAIRIYSPDESQLINSTSQDFLLMLERQGLITPEIREIIIECLFSLMDLILDENSTIPEEDLVSVVKWVTIAVLMCFQSAPTTFNQLEFIVLQEAKGSLQ